MKRTIIVAVLAISLLVAGCGGPGEAPDDDGEGGEEPADDPAGGEDENAEEEDEGAFVIGSTGVSPSAVTVS